MDAKERPSSGPGGWWKAFFQPFGLFRVSGVSFCLVLLRVDGYMFSLLNAAALMHVFRVGFLCMEDSVLL